MAWNTLSGCMSLRHDLVNAPQPLFVIIPLACISPSARQLTVDTAPFGFAANYGLTNQGIVRAYCNNLLIIKVSDVLNFFPPINNQVNIAGFKCAYSYSGRKFLYLLCLPDIVSVEAKPIESDPQAPSKVALGWCIIWIPPLCPYNFFTILIKAH